MITSALGNSSAKKSPDGHGHAVREPRRRYPPLRDRRHDRQVVGGAGEVRVRPGEHHAEHAGGAAHVADRPVPREVELLRQRLEVAARDAGHRAHELLEASGVAVELLEHRLAGVLDLVLRATGLERLRQISPEAVEAGIRHLENPADVGRAVLVEEDGGVRGVAVAAVRARRRPARGDRGRRACRGSRRCARECSPIRPATSSPVIDSDPSWVNSSSSTADSTVFEGQKPMPTCMM